MKKLLAILLLATMIFSAVACATENDPIDTDETQHNTESELKETETETETGTETETETEAETEIDVSSLVRRFYYLPQQQAKYFKTYGRMATTQGGITCDNTATGIEFGGIMYGEVAIKVTCSADTYFTVFVDGERSETRFHVGNETKDLIVANFEEAGEHSIRFLKQSEAQRSIAAIRMVTVTGKLDPPPANRPLIQVIGDSITCGYGNLTINGTADGGSAHYEDGTKAFPFLTAEALNADVEVLGCSGVAIDKGYTSFNEMQFYTTESLYRDRIEGTNVKHDFTKDRVPDLVIINLGTNDASNGSPEATFKKNARELIEFIRTTYGKDIPIVWTCGMMGSGCSDWVKATVSEMGGAAKDLYVVDLARNQEGGGGHPTVMGHKVATTTLTNFIMANGLLPGLIFDSNN